MDRTTVERRIAELIREWKTINMEDLAYKKNLKKYGKEEAISRYNRVKEKFRKVRDILKHWDLLKNLKTNISAPPWDEKYYQFKNQEEDNLRFYFFFNPVEPESNSPTKSLQLNLEFWSDGTVYIFFRPFELLSKYKERLIGLKEFLEKTGYVSYILNNDFIYYDGSRIDGSKRDTDEPDWNDWVGRAFNIRSITAEDILNSFEDLKKAFDLYMQAVQEVLNVRKFREED